MSCRGPNATADQIQAFRAELVAAHNDLIAKGLYPSTPTVAKLLDTSCGRVMHHRAAILPRWEADCAVLDLLTTRQQQTLERIAIIRAAQAIVVARGEVPTAKRVGDQAGLTPTEVDTCRKTHLPELAQQSKDIRQSQYMNKPIVRAVAGAKEPRVHNLEARIAEVRAERPRYRDWLATQRPQPKPKRPASVMLLLRGI